MEDKTKSVLPEYNPKGNYGYFGYQGVCCDMSIRSNSVPKVQECIERGFMNKDTRTLDGYGMVKYARKYGAEDVAAKLVSLGWDNEEWPHNPVV